MTNNLLRTEFISGDYDRLYRKHSGRFLWGERPGRILPSFSCLLGRPSSVLDLGCGDGKNALYLASRGHRVDGLDKSEVAIDAYRNRMRQAKVANAVAEIMDVHNYLPNRYYEGLVSYGLFHCLDPSVRLSYHRRCFGALQEGGWIAFCSLTDDLPLPDNHMTPGVTLASNLEIDQLFEDFKVVLDYASTLYENHLPEVGWHHHSVRWIIARKNSL
jgi:tellurite methyltransferase